MGLALPRAVLSVPEALRVSQKLCQGAGGIWWCVEAIPWFALAKVSQQGEGLNLFGTPPSPPVKRKHQGFHMK